MLLKIFLISFVLFGILFVLSVIINKIYVKNLKDNMKISDYIAFLAICLALYIISAIFAVFFIHPLKYKLVMAFFAILPFIVGKLATYKYEWLFTLIQIISVCLSILFVLLYVIWMQGY